MQDLRDILVPRRKGSFVVLVIAIIILLIPMFLAVVLANRITMLGYKIAELTKRYEALSLENERLKEEFLELKGGLERIAKRMGFRKPKPSQLVIIKRER